MNKEFFKGKLYWILSGVVLLAIIVIAACSFFSPKEQESSIPAPVVTAQPSEVRTVIQQVEVPVEKIVPVEVEKKLDIQTVEDGLRSMGTLLTAEYYFTDVQHLTKDSKLNLWADKTITYGETSVLFSYDGVVTAGLDFSAIELKTSETPGEFIVYVPKSRIQNVDIDPNSFVLYSEKNNWINPLSMNDVNDSLIALEKDATEQALARGILETADENAQLLIRNFLSGYDGLSVSSIILLTK